MLEVSVFTMMYYVMRTIKKTMITKSHLLLFTVLDE
jgi:hypothetical protein